MRFAFPAALLLLSLLTLPSCFSPVDNGPGKIGDRGTTNIFVASEATPAPAPNPGGNGEGYGGGNPEYNAAVRDSVYSLQFLRTAGTTRSGAALCPLGRLTIDQQVQCGAILARIISQMPVSSDPTFDPTSYFSPSTSPLYVPDAQNHLVEVIAKTIFGRDGNVLVNQQWFVSMQRVARVAQLIHELGHKLPDPAGQAVVRGETFITDNQSLPSYNFVGGGKKALDDAAEAGAQLLVSLGLNLQDPPPIPGEIAAGALCPVLGARNDRTLFMLGAWVDATHAAPGPDDLASLLSQLDAAGGLPLSSQNSEAIRAVMLKLVSGETARRARIRQLYKKYLLRLPAASEEQVMLNHLANGDTEAVISSIILSDPAYVAAHQLTDADGWIRAVYLDTLGRSAFDSEVAYQKTLLTPTDNVAARAAVVMTILTSPGAILAQDLSWYRDLFNRAPSPGETIQSVSGITAANVNWEQYRTWFLAAGEYPALQRARFLGYAAKFCDN